MSTQCIPFFFQIFVLFTIEIISVIWEVEMRASHCCTASRSNCSR